MPRTVKQIVLAIYHAAVEPLAALARRRKRLAMFERRGEAWPPEIAVRALRARDCPPRCKADPHRIEGVVARYLGVRRRPSRLTPLIVDLDRYPTNAAFESYVRKRSSRTLPKVRRAQRLGYQAKRFPLARHVHDVHAVKTSMKRRAFGLVLDYWLLRLEDVGKPAVKPVAWRTPPCRRHWTMWWGVFVSEPGHAQGAVTVDERLVAYVKLVRRGDFIHYADLMGHGDHLNENVMALLHFEIMRWLLDREDPLVEGVRAVLYGAAEQGGDGLVTWKKRAGFEPARLTLIEES
ncbi:hypothetical protein [Hansschlegelia sp.]|uniref:hypothetical protein n=1 Tax=Hansschlegelia sp. TaxID=2041892 RepID=UPI002CACB920|nr:hypothetical protein [Hansschlegelia sp.]HVI30404.1 hypothetical protein [Hansschlegelia sp.]